MLQALFHAWERRLASVTTDRVVRPFDWGLDWIPPNGTSDRRRAGARCSATGSSHVMADTDAFFTPPPTTDYHARRDAADGDRPADVSERVHHAAPENNTVYCRYFRRAAQRTGARPRAAVLVLPQWNSDAGGHVGLCQLLAWNGMSALRLSLPYHDQRMPPELHRADYIVSANVARTRAGLPAGGARRAARDRVAGGAGLRAHRHPRHQPRLVPRAADDGARAADPGARRSITSRRTSPTSCGAGCRREHVREGLDGHIELDLLRDAVEADQPALVSRAPARSRRRCSSTRATT